MCTTSYGRHAGWYTSSHLAPDLVFLLGPTFHGGNGGFKLLQAPLRAISLEMSSFPTLKALPVVPTLLTVLVLLWKSPTFITPGRPLGLLVPILELALKGWHLLSKGLHGLGHLAQFHGKLLWRVRYQCTHLHRLLLALRHLCQGQGTRGVVGSSNCLL